MNLKEESKSPAYSPVDWVYREVIEEQIENSQVGKIFYFCKEEGICSAEGKIIRLEEIQSQGVFIHLEPQHMIRIDRIITLFGKPGAAYEEYDSYANACMDCMGGHEMSDFD